MATVGTRLVCGTGVLCGTGTIVGQGPFPDLWVQYSTDAASDTDPLWRDATAAVRGFNTDRGRNSELDEVDAGTATLVLSNRDRTFDPTVNATIRPMNRWRIRSQFSGATEDIFVGYAESYDQQWPGGGKDAVAVASAVDEFSRLARRKLPTTSPPRDTYADVIAYDKPAGYWRMGEPDGTLVVVPVVGKQFESKLVPSGIVRREDAAIIGDNDFALSFVAGAYVGTSDTSTGDDEDFGGTSDLTIETWFRASSLSPGSTQTLVIGPKTTGAVITWHLYLNTSGAIGLDVRNSGGTTATVTSSVLTINTWYHVAGTWTGGTLLLYVNGSQIASTALSGSLPTALDTGTFMQVGDSVSAGKVTVQFDELAIYRTALSATRIAAHYEAGTARGFAREQFAGQRAVAILDRINSGVPRSIRTGTRAMSGAYMHGQDPLVELRRAARAELPNGLLFVSRSGEIVLLDNGHRTVSPWNTVQVIFGDAGGSEIPYEEVDVDYSQSFLLNKVTATRQDGPTQEASDSASIVAYDEFGESITDLPLTSDADALAIAQALVAKHKDPHLRVLSLEVNTVNPNGAEAVLALDIGDRIEVRWTPPGGGNRIIEVLFVQHINISGDARSPVWRVVLGVAPL